MDARGPAETRLLAVERGIGAMDTRIRALRRKTIAASQATWQLWADLGNISGPQTTTPTSYSGAVDGCISGVSGIVVTITDHATGAPLGMVTSGAGGAISGTLSITGTVSVDFTAGGTGWVTTTTNVSMTQGGTYTGINVNLSAATGYVCVPTCNFPVPTTLTVTDSLFGSFTATFIGVLSGNWTWQTSGVHINFPGGGGCAAAAGVPATYTLQITGSYSSQLLYTAVSLFNACPAATGNGHISTHTLGSAACPPSFSVVFTNAASQAVYEAAGAGTYTITWHT